MSSGCSGPFGGWHPAQIHDIPVMLLETSPLPYREVWERERPRPLLTLAQLCGSLVFGVAGYLLHMAVHGA